MRDSTSLYTDNWRYAPSFEDARTLTKPPTMVNSRMARELTMTVTFNFVDIIFGRFFDRFFYRYFGIGLFESGFPEEPILHYRRFDALIGEQATKSMPPVTCAREPRTPVLYPLKSWT